MASDVTDRQQEPRCELCDVGSDVNSLGEHRRVYTDGSVTHYRYVTCPRSTAKEESER